MTKIYYDCYTVESTEPNEPNEFNESNELQYNGEFAGKTHEKAAWIAFFKILRGKEAKQFVRLPMILIQSDDESYQKYYWVGERKELEEPQKVIMNEIDPMTGKNKLIEYSDSNNVTELDQSEFEKLTKITNERLSQEIPILKQRLKENQKRKRSKINLNKEHNILT